LKEGADVSVLGSVVGTVRTLGVRNGRMEAEIAIKPEFAQFVRTDSTATIHRPLGFGDVAVEITRGAAGAPALKPGDPIHVTSEPGATAAVEQVAAAVTPVPGGVGPVTTYARNGPGNVSPGCVPTLPPCAAAKPMAVNPSVAIASVRNMGPSSSTARSIRAAIQMIYTTPTRMARRKDRKCALSDALVRFFGRGGRK